MSREREARERAYDQPNRDDLHEQRQDGQPAEGVLRDEVSEPEMEEAPPTEPDPSRPAHLREDQEGA